MNKGHLKILAGTAAALIAFLIVMQMSNRDSGPDNARLFPGLKAQVNDIAIVTITRAADETPTVIRRASGTWVIASRDDYPIDIGKLREFLLQITDAKILERKTSNPDLYAQLGVQDPAIDGSKGARVQVSGEGVAYDFIVGNVAQPGYRYVRKFDDSQSWLIDKDPRLPRSAAEWLVKDIIDVNSTDVRSVTITHPDGEKIRISKESADTANFDVADIPDGRELSYSTVANSIAGALSALTLDDVRKSGEAGGESVSATFESFDGRRFVVLVTKDDDENWITVTPSPVGDATADEAAINDRLAGWQFRIADYKANQLTRRWDDILKAEAE